MNKHKLNGKNMAIPYVVDESSEQLCRYGGIPALKQSWQHVGVEAVLQRANVHYGQAVDKAGDMSFLLVSAPFVDATSHRKVTQRFGGEASELETDLLLTQQAEQSINQRMLNRFVNTDRYDWLQVQAARAQQMQQLPGYKTNRKGVVILDDWPMIKAFASAMPYLSPIWDNNLKCSLPGYAIVHLHYYHPYLKSYSLGMYPWLKKSLTGEKKSKGKARRPAREDEEKNKLDIALTLIDRILSGLNFAALVFDNWYTARWFGHELTERGIAWIGDAAAKQKLEVAGCYLSVPQIYEKYRSQLKRVPGQKRSVKAISLPAVLRPDGYTKVAQNVQIVVVTGLHKPRDNDKGYKVLVCNRRHYRIQRVVRLFTYRPKIEAVHRHGKQEVGWLDFHNRSVPALLCHLTFCMFRCDCLDWLQQSVPAACGFSPRQFIDHCLKATVRLIRQAGRWIACLKPEHPLWSFFIRPKMIHQRPFHSIVKVH
jgi:hypothetical protein